MEATGLSKAPVLELTSGESRLQTMLLDVAKHINPENPSELRFAGGWVRDKLLGKDSHDIDIAISDMTGEMFGLRMQEYLERPGVLEKYGMGDEIVKGLHKIAANPEKSKQLETATTKVFGLDLDLVNLRKETYRDDSRNPVMEFGTPEEDAMRRDATINAMFYNLQTSRVEDLTRKGLHDMDQRLIRTPLAPYQTFRDDPLRILRLIRFASRLEYTIDPAAIEAMKDSSIKDALRAKISRERVGIEIEKMLKGNDPRAALNMIDVYGLYQTIFVDPSKGHGFTPETGSWYLIYDFTARLTSQDDDQIVRQLRGLLLPDDDHVYFAWILAAHAPWASAPEPEPIKNKKTPPPVAVQAAREGIKAPNKVCDIIGASISNYEHIINIKDEVVGRAQQLGRQILSKSSPSRGKIGMAVRSWGPSWRSQVIFAMMIETVRAENADRDVLLEYLKFLETVQKQNLWDVCNIKPLVDGKWLAQELNVKPGPWMKDALQVVLEWQLEKGDDATIEGAIQAVKHGEITTILAGQFLELTIRPLFSKTKNPHITQAGHRVIPGTRKTMEEAQARKLAWNDGTEAARPWKEDSGSALELLRWCVLILSPLQIQQHWGRLVPPILTLVDDYEIHYKVMGLYLLRKLLDRTSHEHLTYTGTGSLFENAIKPAFSYLPTLTPEDDAIPVLSAALQAWLTLSSRRWPPRKIASPAPSQKQNAIIEIAEDESTQTGQTSSATLLSVDCVHEIKIQVLKGYILPALRHVESKFPRVSQLLLVQLQEIMTVANTLVISEKNSILPLLAEYLSDPVLVKTCPELVIQATRTLKTVVSCAWPLVNRWRADLIGPLSDAWITSTLELQENNNENISHSRNLIALRAAIADCSLMVVKALRGTEYAAPGPSIAVWKRELHELVEAEPLCAGLFSKILD